MRKLAGSPVVLVMVGLFDISKDQWHADSIIQGVKDGEEENCPRWRIYDPEVDGRLPEFLVQLSNLEPLIFYRFLDILVSYDANCCPIYVVILQNDLSIPIRGITEACAENIRGLSHCIPCVFQCFKIDANIEF